MLGIQLVVLVSEIRLGLITCLKRWRKRECTAVKETLKAARCCKNEIEGQISISQAISVVIQLRDVTSFTIVVLPWVNRLNFRIRGAPKHGDVGDLDQES